MTNFEHLKSMNMDELAAATVKELHLFMNAPSVFMSQLDATVHSTSEVAVAHNKELLTQEVKE